MQDRRSSQLNPVQTTEPWEVTVQSPFLLGVGEQLVNKLLVTETHNLF